MIMLIVMLIVKLNTATIHSKSSTCTLKHVITRPFMDDNLGSSFDTHAKLNSSKVCFLGQYPEVPGQSNCLK